MQDDLGKLVLRGDRRALAKAITLAESARDDHREQFGILMSELLPYTGGAVRLGISGPPGVGKSTFIEALGLHLIALGQRVAVLAVDPSSQRSGGSILGDKTRMMQLSSEADAFIRPSPSGGVLGGVAARTADTVLLCEAAGFDVVLIETVGVGQSETMVAQLSDLFLLLVQPGGGDELQGIKRGIMELADIIVVNKADGDQEQLASQTAGDYANAVHLLRPKRPGHHTEVRACSSLTSSGVADLWQQIAAVAAELRQSGTLQALRSEQRVDRLWSELHNNVTIRLRRDLGDEVEAIQREIAEGRIAPSTGADVLLDRMLGAKPPPE